MTALENIRLDTMEDKLDDVSVKVDKIFVALTGGDLQTDKGLIKEFESLRERVTKIEAFKSKIIWISLGAGLSAGLSVNKVIEWIQLAGK